MISNWLLFQILFSASFGLITNPTRSLFHQNAWHGKMHQKMLPLSHRKISNKTPQIVMRWRNPYSMWEGKQMTNIGILQPWRWNFGGSRMGDMETSSFSPPPKKKPKIWEILLMATTNRASVHQLREVGSLESRYLQGFIDPRWCTIASINIIRELFLFLMPNDLILNCDMFSGAKCLNLWGLSG